MSGSPPVVDPNGDVNLEFNGLGTYTANNDLGPFGGKLSNMTFRQHQWRDKPDGREIDPGQPRERAEQSSLHQQFNQAGDDQQQRGLRRDDCPG